MVPQEETLVRGVNNDGVLVQTRFIHVIVHLRVFGVRFPWAVRRFVMAHEEKGLLGGSFLEKFKCRISNNVSGIARKFFSLAHLDKIGVMIDSLARQDLPIVEPGGI